MNNKYFIIFLALSISGMSYAMKSKSRGASSQDTFGLYNNTNHVIYFQLHPQEGGMTIKSTAINPGKFFASSTFNVNQSAMLDISSNQSGNWQKTKLEPGTHKKIYLQVEGVNGNYTVSPYTGAMHGMDDKPEHSLRNNVERANIQPMYNK